MAMAAANSHANVTNLASCLNGINGDSGSQQHTVKLANSQVKTEAQRACSAWPARAGSCDVLKGGRLVTARLQSAESWPAQTLPGCATLAMAVGEPATYPVNQTARQLRPTGTEREPRSRPRNARSRRPLVTVLKHRALDGAATAAPGRADRAVNSPAACGAPGAAESRGERWEAGAGLLGALSSRESRSAGTRWVRTAEDGGADKR